MRIVRFETADGRELYGAVEGDGRARVLRSNPLESLDVTDEVVRIGRLLTPIRPPNVFAIGRNYAAHIAETGAQRPERPLVFMKPTTALTDPGAQIVIPASAPDEVDFEAELAAVIGRPVRNVAPDAALEHVLGYTCANDVTARDCQAQDKQWSRAKGFDSFCPLGPELVTADAFDPSDVRVQSRLNGEVMQDARTSAMLYNVAELISYLSHQFTLLAGTLVLTGTPEGVGVARTPPVFLKAGDRIEIEIDGIGVLVNDVVAEATAGR